MNGGGKSLSSETFFRMGLQPPSVPDEADFDTPPLPFHNYTQTYAGWQFCCHSTPGSKADLPQENSPTGSAYGPIARRTALR